MRRIYESEALTRDDEPFTPHEREDDYEPQAFRSIDASAWSDRLIPHGVRCRSVRVDITTPQETFENGQAVPFQIRIRNSLPIPITVRTVTPVIWTWNVDGAPNANRSSPPSLPEEQGALYLDRGETRTFGKRWNQRFQVAKRRWEPAPPGTYSLGVEINTERNYENLRDSTEIRIAP